MTNVNTGSGWNELKNQAEIDQFLKLVWHFHDSCIKELCYLSGAYVNEGLWMHPINDQRKLRILFQRQSSQIPVLELQFSGLQYMQLSPVDESYTCEILDATMLMDGELVYWCDSGGLSLEDISEYSGTVICASRVSWRAVTYPLGDSNIYGCN